jgi:hypothetical protein
MKTTKILLLFLIVITMIACSDDNIEQAENIKCSGASFIVKNNDQLLLSGYVNIGNKIKTKYWIDSLSVDSNTFINSFKNGNIYDVSNVPGNNLSPVTYVQTTLNGEKDIYNFDQGIVENDKQLFYYKNNDIIRIDTSATGTITSVSIFNDKPYFAGYFSKISYTEDGTKTYQPKSPFYWNGNSKLIELPMPNVFWFRGISCIYVEGEDYYIGGLMDFPMYWKNTEIIKLGTLYGEVHQIVKSGQDVYAVGFYNKNNSNSTGHTACYWKNGELFELADNAQASGIYIDGNDIYVSGSTGEVGAQYKACYWKNGVRVDLPN